MSRDIHIVSPVPADVWKEVFDADKQATPFQTSSWMSGMCSDGRFSDQSRLYITPKSRIVVPLAARHLLPGLSVAASLPHGFGTGGMLSDTPLTGDDVRAVMQDLATLRFASISVRPNPQHALLNCSSEFQGWRATARTSHILDLTGGFERVWPERIHGEKRNKIRKAIKAGLTVESGNSDQLLGAFYDIYLRWCEGRSRKGSIPASLARLAGRRREPFWKFVNGARAMGDAFKIYVALLGVRPVAASILLIAGSSAAYWRGVSDMEFAGPVAANDLLQKHMIEQACKSGCSYYHMGESGGVLSLMQFKESYGAKAHHYSEYVCERLPISATLGSVERAYSRAADMLMRSGRNSA